MMRDFLDCAEGVYNGEMDNRKTAWHPDFFSGKLEDAAREIEATKTITLAFAKKWRNRLPELANPLILAEAVSEYEKLLLEHNFGDAGYFFWLKSRLDQNDDVIKAALSESEDFETAMKNEIVFFEQAIAKIPAEKHEEILNNEKIRLYAYFVKRIFDEAKHQLPEGEEKLVNLFAEPAKGAWLTLVSKIISGETREVANGEGVKEKKTFPELMSLLESKDKSVRDEARVVIDDILRSLSPVAEAEMNAVLRTKKVIDERRGYANPRSERLLADDISEEAFSLLQKTATDNFSIARDYYALKAKLLNVPALRYHERNVEYGKTEKSYSYEESLDLLRSVLGELDPEFAEILESFTDGRLDAFPNYGKEDGAFCAHGTKRQPVYILLNHTGKLSDVLTMAHELGHGIHYELMRKKQTQLYYQASLATAEVASTFMEDFVFDRLVLGADNEEKLALMVAKLNRDISTIFRQIAAVNFEDELHAEFRAKSYLPAKAIGEIFLKHMGDYTGSAVLKDEGSERWWMYWEHLRRFFYNYSYAHGLLISKALQAEVKKDPAFILKVKEFMAAGSSMPPHDIFRNIGIDASKPDFWMSGIGEVKKLLEETAALAAKLGKA